MLEQPVKGVIPPMITPFKENGDVDYDGFRFNLERWNEDELSGYLVLGSNSETVYLNEPEKMALIELTVKTSKKGRLILAGTGGHGQAVDQDVLRLQPVFGGRLDDLLRQPEACPGIFRDAFLIHG